MSDEIQTELNEEDKAYLATNASKPADDPGYDSQEAAAAVIALMSPRLYKHVAQLSNGQLRRLIKSLVVYPLENIPINKKNYHEYEAYKLAEKMLQSKFLLILSTAYEAEEQRKQRVEEAKKEEEAKTVSPAVAEDLTGDNNVK